MLFNYKILSFCISAKLISRKSVICNGYNKQQAADQMGICLNTFNVYLFYCLKAGLVKKVGKHYQFIKLGLIIQQLFPDFPAVKHAALFRGKKFSSKPKFSEIYNYTQFSFAKINYKQQQYSADKKAAAISQSQVSQSSSLKNIKRLARQAASLGIDTRTHTKRLKESYEKAIVTGSKHTGKILGCSQATANNRLHRWHKQGYIRRQVIKKHFCFNGSPAAISAIGGSTYIFRSFIDNSLFEILGSKIGLIELSSYKK